MLKKLFNSRRFVGAVIGMTYILILGLHGNIDVSMAIATIVSTLSIANAMDKKENPAP